MAVCFTCQSVLLLPKRHQFSRKSTFLKRLWCRQCWQRSSPSNNNVWHYLWTCCIHGEVTWEGFAFSLVSWLGFADVGIVMAMQRRYYSNSKKHVESSIVALTQRSGHFQNAPLSTLFFKKKNGNENFVQKGFYAWRFGMNEPKVSAC